MNTEASRTNGRVAQLRMVAALLFGIAASAGCQTVEQDTLIRDGGTSPDPTAVLEGSILYSGPKPTCMKDPDSGVWRVQGNMVLLLYFFNNPPFPEGNATSSENLLVVSGDRIFTVDDCLAAGAPVNFDDRIARSVPFRWPGVTLPLAPAAFQIRGFYDYDEDFIPMFAATRLPTAGDIMGAALHDVQDFDSGLLQINLPGRDEAAAKNGYVSRGISVAIGSPVLTERPAFRLNEDRQMSAAAPFSVVLSPDDPTLPDPLATLQKFRGLTCQGGAGDGIGCGISVLPLPKSEMGKFAAAGVKIALDNPNVYTTYVHGVDVKTVRANEPDIAQLPDGVIDSHPVLKGLGIKLYEPLFVLARIPPPESAALETQAGIPSVRLLGSVILEDPPAANQFTRPFQNGAPIPMAVPPVAMVQLKPNRLDCTVPYFPPGTPAAIMSGGAVANCGELPTGVYSTTVVSGLMGKAPDPVTMTLGEDTLSSFQAWTIPNELGTTVFTNPNTMPAQLTFPDQSEGGAFVITSSSSTRPAACTANPVNICKGESEPNVMGEDSFACLPKDCCDAVVHLCGLPLCAQDKNRPKGVLGGPTKLEGKGENDRPIPDCVPFDMPKQCCPAATARATTR